MKFSSSLENIPDYPFQRVARISRKVTERDGVKVINARIGIPDREAPETVKKAMTKFLLEEHSTLGYPCDAHPERGIPELIDAIIENYRQKHAVSLKPENIVVTGWNKEVLFNMVRLFERGTVYVPDPVYPVYEPASLLANHNVKRVRMATDTKWLPEFDFDGDSSGNLVAFYFCDPNNPTGSVADREFYVSLLEKMKAAGATGIFDKAYKDYTYDDNTRPISITQVPGMMDHGFEVVSFSKHYNFVGVGLGWIVSSEENISRWLKLSSQYSQGVEWYKQKAGVEALTNPSVREEMQDYRKELKERRDTFVRGLRELGLEVAIPGATPYLWIKVPEGYDDEKFVLDVLIDKAHVALMPGSYFGNNGRGYMRATLFLSKAEIEEVLGRIEKVKSW
ncbi:MAG TPA: pyridoxal phosphate-dependent aminotransferase [Dehalococcoidia bacterium]|nr:pyridoxal phosphate-dependent aminotransferase [Dehalococcoidia bacterium]